MSTKIQDVLPERRFIDKRSNKIYYGNGVQWIVSDNPKFVGYVIKQEHFDFNKLEDIRVEPYFKKKKYKVPKYEVIFIQKTLDDKGKNK